MNQATLFVSRTGDSRLEFVLQQAQPPRPPLVRKAIKELRPQQRQEIDRALENFAVCLQGLHADEPRFRELGQVLYSVVLPDTIRVELLALQQPLAVLTDDPSLPWEILHDSQEFLALKVPLSRQLVIHNRMGSLLRPPELLQEGFSSLIIADPLGDLPGAREEGEALHELFRSYGESDLLLGDRADWAAIQCQLVSKAYSVIHYCGHMEYDSSQRLSTIHFRGGGQLSADEVLSTFRGCPIVFLNACASDPHARSSATVPAAASDNFGRTESFAQAFMLGNERGVAVAVIGTMWLVPDEPREAGRVVTRAFYQHLLNGGCLAEAMQASRKLARERQWGPMAWGPYVLYGDPCLRPYSTSAAAAHDRQPKLRDMIAAKDRRFPQSAPSEAPPADSDSQAELHQASPLNNTARKVFHAAMREMSRAGQGALSSLHLLIGLCDAKVPALEQAADAVDLDASCIRVRACKRVARLVSAKKGGGISVNVLQMLGRAVKRAAKAGHDTVTSEDLLVGLLKCGDSEAVNVLKSFAIDPEALLRQLHGSPDELPQPPPSADEAKKTGDPRSPPSDPLAEWVFDAPARRAMELALRLARQARQGFLGTPHLLLGLIVGKDSWADEFLRGQGLETRRLASYLAQLVGIDAKQAEVDDWTPLQLRPRCRAILERALNHARNASQSAISEVLLLRSILEEKDGHTTDVIQAMKADPQRLLATLLGEGR
jgi:hypothetical protein